MIRSKKTGVSKSGEARPKSRQGGVLRRDTQELDATGKQERPHGYSNLRGAGLNLECHDDGKWFWKRKRSVCGGSQGLKRRNGGKGN